MKFVQTANTFKSEVKVVKDDQEANGDAAAAAVAALAELVGTGFGEGVDP